MTETLTTKHPDQDTSTTEDELREPRGETGEPDSELQREEELAGQRAAQLEGVLHAKMHARTEEIRGARVDVNEARVGDDATVKGIDTPDGHATVIELTGSGSGSTIVIKHDPSSVSIDGQEASIEGVESAMAVMEALANTPDDQAEEELEDTEEQETIDEKPEKSEAEMQAEARFKQAIGPYVSGPMRPVIGQIMGQLGMNPAEAMSRLSSGDVTLDAQTAEAIKRLRASGAQPNSPIWREDPRNRSMLGAAAAESRQLLGEALKSALR